MEIASEYGAKSHACNLFLTIVIEQMLRISLCCTLFMPQEPLRVGSFPSSASQELRAGREFFLAFLLAHKVLHVSS